MKRKVSYGLILIAVFIVASTPFMLKTSTSVTAITRAPPWKRVPSVTITDPSDGETVSGVIDIKVRVSDKNAIPDIYIDGIFVAHATTYTWDTTSVEDGSHTIYAEATNAAGTGSDTNVVTVDNGGGGGGGGGGDGVVHRYAVIVGISDYKAINDLSFCDEDATDWYYHLHANGYTCEVYGDGHTANYPKYDGYATEYNVKQAIAYYLSIADADDIFVYASSGHGTYDRKGRSVSETLCMWDYAEGENGEDGSLHDVELSALFENAVCKWFIFLDHCYSGGMNEVMDNANAANGYLTTTCTEKGYGYDMSEYENGAWTYFFLEYSWIGHYDGSMAISMEDIFAYALANYPYGGNDTPQEFDGDTSNPFYL
ncbi:MAG: caspase family protein [Candidatus Heimdallarchaeota archaeon]|nr:caspase family protein [Candidatus Heimdallarchaeota archaeon]